MNLTTTYLGLKLQSPLIVGASPICDDLAACQQFERAGAGAIVMHSLFEEQLLLEEASHQHLHADTAESHPEARDYFPKSADYALSPELYRRQLVRLKSTLTIPVIASLNGTHPASWAEQARLLAYTGADALELNLYQVPTDPAHSSAQIEAEQIAIVRAVAKAVRIPVSVKLSPWLTAPAHYVRQLDEAGAAGVVLFNRFYQPDFNIETLDVEPELRLSNSSELLLRLRWLAILSAQSGLTFAASGGVHQPPDVIKALLAGAHATQLVSALLRRGPDAIAELKTGLAAWMTEHDYTSIDQLRGALNLARCPDPAAHERANYLKILQSWRN
jgi:dihydroorotate dehydrogenase (fumarate)